MNGNMGAGMRQCRRKNLCAAVAAACCAGVVGAALTAGSAEVLVSLADDRGVLAGVESSDSAIVVRTAEAAFRDSVPLGAWYDVDPVVVNKDGVQTRLNRRTMRMEQATYRGQLNILLRRLKDENPGREIYVVTPAADAQAVSTNGVGAVLGDYAAAVREAGAVWAVTVVDLAGDAPVAASAARLDSNAVGGLSPKQK